MTKENQEDRIETRHCQNGCDWPNCTLPKCVINIGEQGAVEKDQLISDLIDILHTANGTGSGAHEIYEYLESKKLVSTPTDKSQEEQIWVSVKDRLPEKNKGVLVFIPQEDEHCTTGMYDVDEKWVLLDDYRVPTCEVTYWRPMVNLPEDKTFNRVHTTEEEDSRDFLIHKLQKENHDMRVILSQYNFE